MAGHGGWQQDPKGYLRSLGYAQQDIDDVWAMAQGDINYAVQVLYTRYQNRAKEDEDTKKAIALSLQTAQQSEPMAEIGGYDAELSKVIEESMKTAPSDYQAENPEQKMRKEGVPVGLKNVGNTCYFNSLLQAYFMMPSFVEEIMKFKPKEEEKKDKPQTDAKKEAKKEEKKEQVKKIDKEGRKKASAQLVHKLQILFSYLICSNRRYVDPSLVIKALVDDYGNPIELGDQKDVGEFNINFLARLNEGLSQEAGGMDSPSPVRGFGLERSTSMGMSIFVPPSTEQLHASFIYRTFFGSMMTFTKSKEQDGQPIELKSTTGFGQVNINPMEANLYDGWEANYFSEIEDFKTPKGFITKAQEEFYVVDPPAVLMLQSQRVTFDKDTKSAKKIMKKMAFDKMIYIDRFMLENRETASKIREAVKDYKTKIKILENTLQKFHAFGAKKLDIEKVLATTNEFVSAQEKSEASFKGNTTDGLTLFDPSQIGLLGKKPKDLQEITGVLNEYINVISKQVKNLEDQLNKYQDLVSRSYEGMKKYGYVLHSILMHSGYPESGHYYSYIYDFDQNKWRKYNDTIITEEKEEIVLKEAEGDPNSTVSAYCFIYVAEKNAIATSGAIRTYLRQFSLSESKLSASPQHSPAEAKKIIDHYTSLVPVILKSEVREDNMQLDNEILQHRAGNQMKKLQNIYTARFDRMMELRNVPEFNFYNFVTYLCSQSIGQYKWYLLNLILKEISQGTESLETLEKDSPLYQKLKTGMLKSCKNAPSSIEIANSEKFLIETHKTAYRKQELDYYVSNYILSSMNSNKWDKAANTIYYCLINDAASQHKRQVKDLAKLLALRMCTYLSELLMQKKVTEAVGFTKFLCQFVISCIDKKDNHQSQVFLWVSHLFTVFNAKLSPEQQDEVGKQLQAIQIGTIAGALILKAEPEDELKTILSTELAEANLYGWKESWNSGKPRENFDLQLPEYLKMNITWYNWHQAMFKAISSPLTVEQMYQDEKKLGIDFKQGLQ